MQLDYEEPTNEERLATLATLAVSGVSPGGALNDLTDDVRLFHTMFGHPAPKKPELQTVAFVERRRRWIESECVELSDATTVADQADAYLDIIYFAVGGLVELGIKFTHRLWRLVQTANLAKVWSDGSVRKNEVGKVQKPDGWVAPDAAIAAAIQQEIDGGSETGPEEAVGTDLLSHVTGTVVERLSIAKGQNMSVLLLAVSEDGYVSSASNMDLDNQRSLLRHIVQSFATGAVLVEAPSAGETVQ